MKKHINSSVYINGVEIKTNGSGNCYYSDTNGNIVIGDDEITINGDNNIIISGDDDINNNNTFTTERRAKILIMALLLIVIVETILFAHANSNNTVPPYVNAFVVSGVLCQVRSVMNIRREGNHWSTNWLCVATIITGVNAIIKMLAGEAPVKIAIILIATAATVASATVVSYRIIARILTKKCKPTEKTTYINF